VATGCGRPPVRSEPAGTGGNVGAAGIGGSIGAAGIGGSAGGTSATGGGANVTCGARVTGSGGTRYISSTQCGDGLDNDGDGKIDYDDPECLGPADNDEGTFEDGIPGENNTDACKQDCFFDGNSGMGDDLCDWQSKCDPLSTKPSCPYDSVYATQHETECSLTASQSQACLDRCGKRVANGCDCFGCCAVAGVATAVRLTYSCTAADFNDPSKCPPCTQVTQCLNPCERCEICVGKPTVPDDCTRPDGCAPYDCPGGATACGTFGVAPWLCPAGTGCVTGCCLPLAIL
jgi:hypothetical protein